jgi:transcriptional regulator with XRE-family HTH domain
MDPKKFGKLIAVLRKEQRDEHNCPYTQSKLAQAAKATASVISNIERGDKASLEPELLLNLANAFQLSTREREEFFLAAMKISQQNAPRIDCDTEDVFKTAVGVIKNLSSPAFIVDHYDNILAVNQIALSLFSYAEKLRVLGENTFAGFNVMRFVFSKQSLFANSINRNREPYLLQSVQFFKAITLPNRANPYYQRMMEAFNTDPDMGLFRSHFAQSTHIREDYLFENSLASLQHPEYGELNFYSPSITPITTCYGNIYLISYLPATASTAEAFASLAKIYSGNVVLLEKFPIDPIFEEALEKVI